MQCKTCHGSMIGNGYNSVVRCEFANEEDYAYHEPDAAPVYCRPIITYTGIGSRSTPPEILTAMQKLAYEYAEQGHILRSGKAEGADSAFQAGVEWYCYDNNIPYQDFDNIEVFVPWADFGKDLRSEWDILAVNQNTLSMAEQLHPAWDNCSLGARKLHARSICQILGKDLDKPSDLVLFYAKESNGKVLGGTATAANLARERVIKTINMYDADWKQQLTAFWSELIK